jgi:hypothetical protein
LFVQAKSCLVFKRNHAVDPINARATFMLPLALILS